MALLVLFSVFFVALGAAFFVFAAGRAAAFFAGARFVVFFLVVLAGAFGAALVRFLVAGAVSRGSFACVMGPIEGYV